MRFKPSEHSRTDTVQDQGGRGAGLARGAVLAHSDLVPRTDAPRDSPSLADSSEVGSTDSETGHLMARVQTSGNLKHVWSRDGTQRF